MPVNLTYQTAFVDDDGKLEFRDDIYGRDRTLLAILKGDDARSRTSRSSTRRTSAIAKCWRCPTSHRCSAGGGLFGGASDYPNGRAASATGGGGDNFFSRLFGGLSPHAGRRSVTAAAAMRKKLSRAKDTKQTVER